MEGNRNRKTTGRTAAGTPKQDPLFRRIVATRDLAYDGEGPFGGA